MSPTYLLTSFVIVATPGTGAVSMLAAITGRAALLLASGVAFTVEKHLGVAYLLWMAGWSAASRSTSSTPS